MNNASLSRASHYLSLFSYFGMLLLILLWYTWISPSSRYPTALVLITLLLPLLVPLRGLLHGRRYTHAWVSMLTLFYFCLGVMAAYSDPAERLYGLLLTTCSVLLFIGCICYVRFSKQTAET